MQYNIQYCIRRYNITYKDERVNCMLINGATSDEVTEKLRDAIISGEYLPSERLIEDNLATRFETSRTPVREAIRNLAASGLVRIEPRKGAVVADINADEIRDIYYKGKSRRFGLQISNSKYSG